MASLLPRAKCTWPHLRRLSNLTAHLNSSNGGSSQSNSFFSSTRIVSVMGSTALALAFSAACIRAQESTSSEISQPEKAALDPNKWIEFKLKQKNTVSHNTKIFRFEFDEDAVLGLNVASCLITRAPTDELDENGNNKFVIRPYTPISKPNSKGYFDLLIKVYPNGKMSQHINKLEIGNTLEIKGPISKLPYRENMKKRIGMVAGGTGITPMLQIIDAILTNPKDDTQVSLIFANTSPQDVLLKKELDSMATSHPNFNVHYLVDRVPEESNDWTGGIGFVSADVIKKALPPPSSDSLILVCGPPGMMRLVSGDKAPDKSQGKVEGLLKELGYSEDHVYKF